MAILDDTAKQAAFKALPLVNEKDVERALEAYIDALTDTPFTFCQKVVVNLFSLIHNSFIALLWFIAVCVILGVINGIVHAAGYVLRVGGIL